jgi:Fe-S oxidoreductase
MTSIPGIALVEMNRNREDALCCGVSAWQSCGQHSKRIQVERLAEAKGTGADLLITACPKCQIHLNCAMTEKTQTKHVDKVQTNDLSVLVAKAMNLMPR